MNGRGSAKPVLKAAAPNPLVAKRIEAAKNKINRIKNLSVEGSSNGSSSTGNSSNGKSAGTPVKDRLVVMVRGPFWLHACWQLSAQSIVRAQSAMGQEWHSARPVLRLLYVHNAGTSTSSERVSRDIAIHGGVQDWYIDVNDPPQTYRLEIGYLSNGGRFYALARSNLVSTPAAASGDTLDAHWADVADDCERIYAMSGGYSHDGGPTELQELFEERLRRPMGNPAVRNGGAADGLAPREPSFRFDIDAEIILHGTTHSGAYVTLQGEPLKVQPDGSFRVRLDLPNRRQVIPIVACSRDGVEQRTVVMAVERNTKVMEPVTRDGGE